ncbi:Hypp5603 [Branchiostoma lanceolatum]|uniref:Hypp5603 protein n=1 Tax=Branchiostoma lanceolatum TaxID=7740 RepID=A0A8J9VQM7_BRALA|nr:Hypp5603 [Branchiostoma lanceolatum]
MRKMLETWTPPTFRRRLHLTPRSSPCASPLASPNSSPLPIHKVGPATTGAGRGVVCVGMGELHGSSTAF